MVKLNKNKVMDFFRKILSIRVIYARQKTIEMALANDLGVGERFEIKDGWLFY